MSNAIEVRNLHYRVKGFQIEDCDLSVPSGSMYGFLGPNGAGKTTTIQILMGLRRARGTVSVLGSAVPDHLEQVLARTGYVPERPHLYPSLTVAESLRYHASFFVRWDWDRANDLVRSFELREPQRVGRLSKGETGKLMVLLALAQRPDLLILDEPTDGLDPVVRRDVMTALLDYVSNQSATVFVSSHLVHELERVCDRVGVMDRGRMVAELPMQDFKSGIKRLRLSDAPSQTSGAPFELLSRERSISTESGEHWCVSGWDDSMSDYLQGAGATLKEVVDLDLEESFVALLSTARGRSS